MTQLGSHALVDRAPGVGKCGVAVDELVEHWILLDDE
jgi:hypothetical protein